MATSLAAKPNVRLDEWGCLFSIIALAGLLGMVLCNTPETGILAWLSSCACLAGALATAGLAICPGPIGWLTGAVLSAAYIVPTVRDLLTTAQV
jgi:hypothetical protein